MKKLALLLLVLLAAQPVLMAADPVTLTLYSSRKAHLIEPVLELYTKQTGVQFNLHTGKPGPLLERLDAAGKNGGADVLLTVDAGNLWHAAQRGLLVPIDSEALTQSVPVALRDPENHWFGLSKRARTLAYNTEKLSPDEFSSYEDLADPKWRGRLCLRTSKKVYNQSLVATLIAHHDVEKAEEIVKGWVANLAAEPFSNDTKALQAVAMGQCDVTIVNSYYFGRLMRKEPDLKLALFWPNQDSQGVHVNISGGGLLKISPHPEEAKTFLEWLAQPEAQSLFAELNLEYPVREDVPPASEVQAWGEFRDDSLNLAEASRLQADAVRLMDRAGYR
ncbi:MAG: extracellular solute-binding protein [Gammaproteobacteria bacterium]|nr:extracellular solute-binding protein [Gammaproteobacteria bacterium]